MKKHFISLLLAALCISLVFVFFSCESNDKPEETTEQEEITEKYPDELIKSDPEDMEYDYFFENVNSLNTAIKKDVERYNNTKIKVIGTLCGGDHLIDYTATTSTVVGWETYSDVAKRLTVARADRANGAIEIHITNDAQYAVAESGDYVKLYGTIKITRDEVSLTNCEYDFIATIDERTEMVRPKSNTTNAPTDTESTPEPIIVPEPKTASILSGGYKSLDASNITITAAITESCVVKLKTCDGITRLSFYVRAGETATVNVPREYLFVYFASGSTWYGEESLFGEHTSYSMDDEICDFTNYSWEYTLVPISDGNFSETPIDEEEFKS